VDNVYQQDVDLYSNVSSYQEVVYSKTGLTPGTHTIKIVEIGIKNSMSSDYKVSLDAFDILSYTDAIAPAAPTGLTALAGNGSVSLSWSANTEPDLAGYNVYRSTTSGGPYVKANSVLVTGTSYSDAGLTNGTTYYYTVTAVDTSSNESSKSSEVSATPGVVVRYEQTDPLVSYTGTWSTWSNSNLSSGSEKYSKEVGASATLTFTGTSVSWITAKAYNRGIGKVYIDGIFDSNVDLYSSSLLYQQVVYTKSGLTSGGHTIRIEVTGTKNASATDTYLGIDAFDVI
jgi:hypothetical protein